MTIFFYCFAPLSLFDLTTILIRALHDIDRTTVMRARNRDISNIFSNKFVKIVDFRWSVVSNMYTDKIQNNSLLQNSIYSSTLHLRAEILL